MPVFQRAQPSSYVTVREIEAGSGTSTQRVREMLEDAFNQNKLVVSSTYRIGRTDESFVLAAPSFSSAMSDMGGCGLQDNPYCALFRVQGSSGRIVALGSKIFGFKKVERFVDDTHAQILTEWSLYNFTSIERQQLNLENGEIVPMLAIEVNQDSTGATVNISGDGQAMTLVVEGTTVSSRLSPDRVQLRSADDRELVSLSDANIQEMRDRLMQDPDRRLVPISIHTNDDDVTEKKVELDLYGIRYRLDLKNRILKKQ